MYHLTSVWPLCLHHQQVVLKKNDLPLLSLGWDKPVRNVYTKKCFFTFNRYSVIEQSLPPRTNINTDTIFEGVYCLNIPTCSFDDSSQKPFWIFFHLYKSYTAVRVSLVPMFGKSICNKITFSYIIFISIFYDVIVTLVLSKI